MDTNVIVLSDTFLAHVKSALLDYPAKYANVVMQDIDNQLTLADKKVHDFVAFIKSHMERHVATAELITKAAVYDANVAVGASKTVAGDIKADAGKVETEVKTLVTDIKAAL